MNVRCDPDQGGCGTLFTIGAAICPNCQRDADEVGVLNENGEQPKVLGAQVEEFEDHDDRPFTPILQDVDLTSDRPPTASKNKEATDK